jgi:hypothetical protein
LLFRSLVAPDDGRPNSLIIFIQQNRPMHLPGETDTSDIIRSDSGLLYCAPHGMTAGLPPVERTLLGPPGLGTREWLVCTRCRANHSARPIDEYRAGAARSNINP